MPGSETTDLSSSALETARQSAAALQARLKSVNDSSINATLTSLAEAIDALVLEQTSVQSKISGIQQQVDRERKKAETLSRASQMVNSSLELNEVLKSVLDMAVELMKAERGFLMLTDENGKKLEFAVSHNLERGAMDQNETKISQSIVDRVFSSGEPIITTDAQNDPRFNSQNSILALHIRSIVCVPLKLKDKVTGVAYLDSRLTAGLFSQQDPELLLSFTNQAALAIENARLFERLRLQLREITSLRDFQEKILEAIANGIITLDGQRRITTFNQAAAETFAVNGAQLVGRNADVVEQLVPGFGRLLDEFVKNGERNRTIELDAPNPKRGLLTLETRFSALEGDSDGRGVAVVVSDLTEQRALERAHAAEIERGKTIQQSFSRYLAPHVVESLMHDPASVHLGGERQVATMLFADIRGFTAMASNMEAEKVVELLNGYLESAVSIVFKHEGLLDKFYGDGIMAVFGPPRIREDDAKRAVECAIELQRVVTQIGPKLVQPISISTGISTGPVVAGHIGSTKRMDYTVIGDAVNLASRLQSAAPAGNVYVDEETYKRSGGTLAAERMMAKIKGKSDLVPVYALKIT